MFARVHPENEAQLLADLHKISASCETLDEWLDVHDYLVRFLRRFARDVGAIRQFSQDVSAPFEVADEMTFASWFRTASARVPVVRCVFDESASCVRTLQRRRMQNLDEPIFGELYSEDAIAIEPGAGHFDLRKPEIIRKHVEGVLAALQATPPAGEQSVNRVMRHCSIPAR